MRIEGSVTTVSWIPSEAVTGAVFRVPFEVGMSHYDSPPPDRVSDHHALLREDKARFVNHLAAWIEVEDGNVIDCGHSGGGSIGSTTLRLANKGLTFAAVPLPDRQHIDKTESTAVRFEQTAGGRTGVPAPRRVNRPPYVQVVAPTAWTTLSLTLHSDGSQEFDLAGASPFPRHWVYDAEGTLVKKSAVIDYQGWSTKAFGRHTPWGDVDSPAFVQEVETALERQLSHQIMRSDLRPRIVRVRAGHRLAEQGQEADELFVLLDGIIRVDVDDQPVAEVGPGAVLGERAILESGRRTAALEAVTACTVAVADRHAVDRESLEELAKGHRQEESSS